LDLFLIKKNGIPLKKKNAILLSRITQLNDRDIRGCRPFRSLHDVKGHSVAFTQRFEAACNDCRVVNENIRFAILLNESKALTVVEPFNRSIIHDNILLSD